MLIIMSNFVVKTLQRIGLPLTRDSLRRTTYRYFHRQSFLPYSQKWLLPRNQYLTEDSCMTSVSTLCRHGGTPLVLLPGACLRHSHSSPSSPSQQDEVEDKLYKWIELKVKGHDEAVLESYKTFVTSATKELDIKSEIMQNPNRNIYRLTLLKSRFIYKKHRVQYEMRTYYRLIKLRHLTGTTADVFLEYIERNLPEGVAMQVKKCSLERMPEHLTKPPEGLESATPKDSGEQIDAEDKIDLEEIDLDEDLDRSEETSDSSSSDSDSDSDEERGR